MRKPHRRPRRQESPKASGGARRFVEATIERLGGQGDGIARADGEICYIPLTAPGDRVIAQIEGKRNDGFAARMTQLQSPSPDRVDPPCPHFGVCGGCALQHLSTDLYRRWKRGILVEALTRAGFDERVIAPLSVVAPGTRRRATFAWSKGGGAVRVGFNARASHRIEPVGGCLLLAPELVALLEPLAALLAEVGEGSGDAEATLSETGVDLLLKGEARLDLFDREKLADFAAALDLARLSWRKGREIEPIVTRREPVVHFAGQKLVLPYGSFLQPSREGERLLTMAAFDAVAASGRVADLFSGCGSFSFVLAQKAEVAAFESDGDAVDALNDAANRSTMRLSAKKRDLFRNPLAGAELGAFDAVLFDPPRAGAAEQAKALAEAGPDLVVAVSCNPGTFARDARILSGGGYEMVWARPVDQFSWSAHLEITALFRRGAGALR